jgi:hypothetical protein
MASFLSVAVCNFSFDLDNGLLNRLGVLLFAAGRPRRYDLINRAIIVTVLKIPSAPTPARETPG